jgi:hypothetical protein
LTPLHDGVTHQETLDPCTTSVGREGVAACGPAAVCSSCLFDTAYVLTQVKSLRKQLEDAKAAAADEAKAPSAAPAPSMAEPAQTSTAGPSPAAAGVIINCTCNVCHHRMKTA